MDRDTDSSGHHTYTAVIILLSVVHFVAFTSALVSYRPHKKKITDICSEPVRTPSDDETQVTETLSLSLSLSSSLEAA